MDSESPPNLQRFDDLSPGLCWNINPFSASHVCRTVSVTQKMTDKSARFEVIEAFFFPVEKDFYKNEQDWKYVCYRTIKIYSLLACICALFSREMLQIWNRTRPRAVVQNQHTRALINAQKYITQVQQQTPESPTVPLTWHACKYKVHKLHHRCIIIGGGDSSVVTAPDSWLKGRGFESLLERRENFLLQGQLSVLTLISVSVPPPCYHSST